MEWIRRGLRQRPVWAHEFGAVAGGGRCHAQQRSRRDIPPDPCPEKLTSLSWRKRLWPACPARRNDPSSRRQSPPYLPPSPLSCAPPSCFADRTVPKYWPEPAWSDVLVHEWPAIGQSLHPWKYRRKQTV